MIPDEDFIFTTTPAPEVFATTDSTKNEDKAFDSGLKIRQKFPETWIWSDLTKFSK